MEGFAYGNARLRAMRSRLLTRPEILKLAGAASLPAFIALLGQTQYQDAIESALVRSQEPESQTENLPQPRYLFPSNLDSIYEGLRQDFIQTIGKIRSFYNGDEKVLVEQVLVGYDLHNLKTVLRGLSSAVARSDIKNALLPVGKISGTVLGEILRAGTVREAIDILATIAHPFAQPLLALRAERPGADLFEMELALDRWRFQEIARYARTEPDGAGPVLAALRLETDISNLFNVLRFVHAPAEQQIIKPRLDRDGFPSLFPGAGSISIEQLQRVYAARNLKAALAILADSPYAQALNQGLAAYEQTGRLSEIEQALRRYQLRWQSGQIARDPLGVGVVIGYLALKANEIANLRRIARGIQLNISRETIREDVEQELGLEFAG